MRHQGCSLVSFTDPRRSASSAKRSCNREIHPTSTSTTNSQPMNDLHASTHSSSGSPGKSPNGYAGAFFPGSHRLTIQGGVFSSSVANHIYPSTSRPECSENADFRRLPFGDIDLQREIICCNESGIVSRSRRPRSHARRMYFAQVFGSHSDMTVMFYEGDDTPHEWQEYLTRHSRIRHPNLLQIFGIATCSESRAVVAHGDLLPYAEFLDLASLSPILTVYVYSRWATEFQNATEYLFSRRLDNPDRTLWIRASTSQLCVELICSEIAEPVLVLIDARYPQFKLHAPNAEAVAISSLGLDQYHQICRWMFPQWTICSISAESYASLGSAVYGAVLYAPMGFQLANSVKIASLMEVEFHPAAWECNEARGEIMENGWTRFAADEIVHGATLRCRISPRNCPMHWLAQGNYIFAALGISADFYEDFAIVASVWFEMTPAFSGAGVDAQEGYLFLCPVEDFNIGAHSVWWPLPDHSPWFWSLDPAGGNRLSAEDAALLGFPGIELSSQAWLASWDATVYEGLGEFHRAKGFDPDSQDVARELGYLLYHPEMTVIEEPHV
ncbi:hypothetical protein FB45DRAFT_929398 [Roridomyces roridus]|uniref:Uncharacterized protein n=1 Tax=Roridomyces roridus TaxID=1738132 RepID=A0AAD7BGA0_9AGAR|nr:hypothetical protein FB45DRAFT_929398 [Roridomyces roridus]